MFVNIIGWTVSNKYRQSTSCSLGPRHFWCCCPGPTWETVDLWSDLWTQGGKPSHPLLYWSIPPKRLLLCSSPLLWLDSGLTAHIHKVGTGNITCGPSVVMESERDSRLGACFICCSKTPNQSHLRERPCFGLDPAVTLHHRNEVMASGARDDWSHDVHHQEPEDWTNTLAFSSLSSFYTVWDSSLYNGHAHV